jgi:hypothetical protein
MTDDDLISFGANGLLMLGSFVFVFVGLAARMYQAVAYDEPGSRADAY